MKTREEILNNWETEQYTDWYAIDSYDPIDGTTHRLFVGNEEDATKMMREYATPTDKAMQPFHRCALISTGEAKAFFEGEEAVIDERGMYDVKETAGMLDVSRQRVHQLLDDGKLEGRKVGKTWYVYRYSVENRLEKSMSSRY